MQFKSLFVLLPLAAAPLAQALDIGGIVDEANEIVDTANDVLSNAADSVSEFFGPDGIGGRIGAYPDCAGECLRRVAGDLKCEVSDIKCLCAQDDGVNWDKKFTDCNNNRTDARCSAEDLNRVDLDGMCRAIKNVEGAIEETGNAFSNLLGLDEPNAAGTVRAVGTATLGVLAAVAGYAVMML